MDEKAKDNAVQCSGEKVLVSLRSMTHCTTSDRKRYG